MLTLANITNKGFIGEQGLSGTFVSGEAHLHDEAFVVTSSALGDELILQPAAFLIQLHDWVLPAGRQNRTLSSHLDAKHVLQLIWTNTELT